MKRTIFVNLFQTKLRLWTVSCPRSSLTGCHKNFCPQNHWWQCWSSTLLSFFQNSLKDVAWSLLIVILTVSANLRQKQHIFTSDQHNKFNHKLKKLNSKFLVIVMMPITMINRCLDNNDYNDGITMMLTLASFRCLDT